MERTKKEILGEVDSLIARADQDSSFREQLVADPRAVIESETGMVVPLDWDVVAISTDDGLALQLANEELPDEYLELVAGGDSGDDNTRGGPVFNSVCG